MSKIIIVGGGPAGLTAAYELSKNQIPCLLLEQADKLGGLARTESYQGYYFDLGGHRFFSKSAVINRLWHEVMGEEMLRRVRLSRIYYNRKFFNYPLKPFNALFGLGLFESLRIIFSYVKQRLLPFRQENSFEDWVVNRFGRRLYEVFFKSYTEKVWGISCREIGAEWAAQRIKGLSLTAAVLNSLGIGGRQKVKTLIDQFEYPRLGPGMMWDFMAEKIRRAGGEIRLNSRVAAFEFNDGRINSVRLTGGEEIKADQFISSLPLRDLILSLAPPPDPRISSLARQLKYRAFLIVALIIDEEKMFPDNWLYVHSPEVKLGRIQNFKNWSPALVPDQAKTCLGLEYFCAAGDALWKMADAGLIELGKKELQLIGLLADPTKVMGGTVLRVNNAYPVYDRGYLAVIGELRNFLAGLSNLQTVGRAGLHRYNNMDHSMLTGWLAAKNIINPAAKHDLWLVNADEDYHEEDMVQSSQ